MQESKYEKLDLSRIQFSSSSALIFSDLPTLPFFSGFLRGVQGQRLLLHYLSPGSSPSFVWPADFIVNSHQTQIREFCVCLTAPKLPEHLWFRPHPSPQPTLILRIWGVQNERKWRQDCPLRCSCVTNHHIRQGAPQAYPTAKQRSRRQQTLRPILSGTRQMVGIKGPGEIGKLDPHSFFGFGDSSADKGTWNRSEQRRRLPCGK